MRHLPILIAVAALTIVAAPALSQPADPPAAQSKQDDAAKAHLKAIADASAKEKDTGALRVRFAEFLQEWVSRTPDMPREKSRALQQERLAQLQAALDTAEAIDLDALMVLDATDNGVWDTGDEIMFSIEAIGSFDGG